MLLNQSLYDERDGPAVAQLQDRMLADESYATVPKHSTRCAHTCAVYPASRRSGPPACYYTQMAVVFSLQQPYHPEGGTGPPSDWEVGLWCTTLIMFEKASSTRVCLWLIRGPSSSVGPLR